MASPKDSSDSALPIILVVSALVGTLMMPSGSLQTFRPKAEDAPPAPATGKQDVEARLWQDPFGILKDVIAKRCSSSGPASSHGLPDDPHGPSALASQIKDAMAQHGKVLIMPVMVAAGNYAEDQEFRRRTRNAIIGGLGRCGYAPEDAAHLGYIEIEWPQRLDNYPGSSNHTNSIRAYSTYEWFRLRENTPKKDRASAAKRVLVLWLQEELFQDTPLARLAFLQSQVAPLTFAKTTEHWTNQWTVIGPYSSTTLRKMYEETCKWKHDPVGTSGAQDCASASRPPQFPAANHTQIISGTASTVDELLEPGTQRSKPREVLIERLRHQHIEFATTACTQDILSAALLRELKLRGVDLAAGSKDHVAMISEWDTFFGRMLPVTFASEMLLAQKPGWERTAASLTTAIHDLRVNENLWPANFHDYTYLRGLDGKLNLEKGDRREARETPPRQDPAKSGGRESTERPEGNTQVDYFRRLGDHLVHLDHELRRQGKGSLRAVGVIGSDVYDTLLIVQAMRQRLPDVLVFTTELDARLWHAEELPWSRNLLVAAGFGIRLSDDLQRQIPPFRESQQTAQFLAVMLALGEVAPERLATISPRVFEIGRSGPVDLSIETNAYVTANNPGLNPPSRTLPPASWVARNTILGLIIISTGLLLLLQFSAGFRQLVFNRYALRRKILMLQQDDLLNERVFVNLLRLPLPTDDPSAVTFTPPDNSRKSDPFLDGLAKHIDSRVDGKFRRALAKVVASPQTEETANPAFMEDKVRAQLLDLVNDFILYSKGFSLTVHQVKLPPAIPKPSGLENAYRNRLALEASLSETWAEFRQRQPGGSADEAQSKTSDPPRKIHCIRSCLPLLAVLQADYRHFDMAMVKSLALGALLVAAIVWDHCVSPSGEPFAVLEGISIWPSEIIRFIALCFGLHALHRARFDLEYTRHGIASEFAFKQWAYPGRTRFRFLRHWQRMRCAGMLRICRRFYHRAELHRWRPLRTSVHAEDLWNQHTRRAGMSIRRWRFVPHMILFAVLAFAVMAAFGFPNRPVRGELASAVDIVLLALCVTVLLYLTFFIVDTTRLCRVFVSNLDESRSEWPPSTLVRFQRLRGDTECADLNEWLDVQIIARYTNTANRLVYYPFIMIFLMILARNRWIDCWNWSWGLQIVLAAVFAYAAYSAFTLRAVAHRARRHALDRLHGNLAMATNQGTAEKRVKGIEQLVKEIESIRTGAFAPFSELPVIRAMLIPSGGIGLLSLLDYLATR